MLRGVGIDIISVERIRDVLSRQGHSFLNRVFTKREQEYCERCPEPATRYAGRFACKEAIGKALGCGIGVIGGWHDFEILSDAQGRPRFHAGERLIREFGPLSILLSISHCKEYATAVAIWAVGESHG